LSETLSDLLSLPGYPASSGMKIHYKFPSSSLEISLLFRVLYLMIPALNINLQHILS
jgi:hypothetical protein